MTIEQIALFLALALVAEILGTIGGFGSSLFFVPIAGYFLDFHSVLGITAVFHVTSNLTKIFFFRKGYDKKLILSLGIPAVVFVIIGAILSKYINSNYLELGLAIFLISMSLILLIFKTIHLEASVKNSVIGGALSGFIAGLVGTGGAIRGMTMAAFNLKTDVFIATSAVIDLGIDSSRTIVYALNGFIHQHDLYLIPMLMVVSFIGTFLGKQILKKISEAQFKNLVLVLVLITGLITLYGVIWPKAIV